MKKRDPVWPWVIFRSPSTMGARGPRTILEMKFTKKTQVMRITVKSAGPIPAHSSSSQSLGNSFRPELSRDFPISGSPCMAKGATVSRANRRAPHACNWGRAPPHTSSPRGCRPLVQPLPAMECLGTRIAIICGRTECIRPKRSPFASPWRFPRKAVRAGLATPRRGGLRTPARKAWASSRHTPIGPPGVRPRFHHDAIPPFASGLPTRTRRARPSEKTPFRIISGVSRKALLAWKAHPSEGRAPHARKRDKVPPTHHPHVAVGPSPNDSR